MNSHLNLFNSYSRDPRNYQLENDLTRGLAICLLEEPLLLHEVLHAILMNKKDTYEKQFSQHSEESNLTINIQEDINNLESFDHLFAVSISGVKMNPENFYNSKHVVDKNPITDLTLCINDILIIFEVKPNNTDCTNQLFNQAFNALKNEGKEVTKENVTAVDLNWKDLMEMVLTVANFHKTINKPSRFLNDFINLIMRHNASWLPQIPMNQQNLQGKLNKAYERLRAGVANAQTSSVKYDDRTGFAVNFGWASEILFDFRNEGKVLRAMIFPGNTKHQGWHLFPSNGEPKFKDEIVILEKKYQVKKYYSAKFSFRGKHITSLDFSDKDLNKNIVNSENFKNVSGRKKRNSSDWQEVQHFFDTHFKTTYDWKSRCNWEKTLVNTNRTQFDLSLGYVLYMDIPFEVVQSIDVERDNLLPLSNFLDEIKTQFQEVLVK